MQGYVNSIIHEVQTADSIHLSDKARKQIERLVMSAVQKENERIYKQKEYWRMEYLRGGR
jgi:hypothetical protein